jgi:hypothetical protein
MNGQPTYHSRDFRTYTPVTEQDGRGGGGITTQLCEELDPESGRWEPFISLVRG